VAASIGWLSRSSFSRGSQPQEARADRKRGSPFYLPLNLAVFITIARQQ
jgi:hypothetical protein